MNILKSVAFFMVALFALSSCNMGKKPRTSKLSIVPQPNEVTSQEGFFEVTPKTRLVLNGSEDLKVIAEFVNMKFSKAAGFELACGKDDGADNFIAINIDESAGLGAEEYQLSVTSKGATIKAGSAKGAFYGMITVLQLLPPEIESSSLVKNADWYMPCVEVKDQPRFPWRGMHLDVCRHFVPVEFIKKQLDVMALFKMNTMHWHLTEDQGWRIEIKKYPLLTEKGSKRIEGEGNEYGGFYTQEQIKEVVAYASERFINIVPEIELPGHALAALTAYPEYSCTGGPFKVRNIWGVEADVYCAGKEETFAFLEDIISEVVALFPGEYFHIGGDECPKARWKECKLCQARMRKHGLKNEHELQSYFVKRIEKVLLAHGKKMIGWDEILEGGLAPSAAVMSWRGEKGGIEAANQGHDVVMTPGNWCYLDHYQGNSNVEPVAIGGYTTLAESYGYDPTPKAIDASKAKHILGTQGNVWSEYMYTPDLFEYRIYPRIIALAEVGWTEKANKDFDQFLDRMDNQFVRLDMHGVNYHIPLPEGPVEKVAFTDETALEFTTTRPVKMVYTLDGSEPGLKSKVYSAPLTFTDDATVKIRSVLNTGKMSAVRTISVEKQTLLGAADVKTTGTGFKMRQAEGKFIKVADMKNAGEWKESVATGEALDHLMKKGPSFNSKNEFASIMTGFITIPEDGVYEFKTHVDQLFIGDDLLINNDGEVKRFSRHNAMIALEKGKHPLKVIYLNNITGGWPQSWNGFGIFFRKAGQEKFTKVESNMVSF